MPPINRQNRPAKAVQSQAQQLKDSLKNRVIKTDTLVPTAPANDRITFHLTLSYQPAEEDAKGGTFVSDRFMEAAGETPFDRPALKIANEAKEPLLAGSWVENPGYILVENLAGRSFRTQPTREEVDAARQSSVYIERPGPQGKFVTLVAIVRPGLPFFGEVPNPSECTMRAVGGDTKVRVMVFPR